MDFSLFSHALENPESCLVDPALLEDDPEAIERALKERRGGAGRGSEGAIKYKLALILARSGGEKRELELLTDLSGEARESVCECGERAWLMLALASQLLGWSAAMREKHTQALGEGVDLASSWRGKAAGAGRIAQAMAEYLGSLKQALDFSLASADLFGQTAGPASEGAIAARRLVIDCHWEMGSYDESARLAGEAARVLEESRGPGDPETILAKKDRGLLLLAFGEGEKAREALQESLAGCGSQLGPDSRLAMETRRGLAEVAREGGDAELANRLAAEALEAAVRVFGPESGFAQELRLAAAQIARETRRLEEAGSLAEEARATYERLRGRSDPLTVSAGFVCATVFYLRGDFAAASQLCERLLDDAEKAPVRDVVNILNISLTRGQTLLKRGMALEARRLFKQNLKGAVRLWGDHDLRTMEYRFGLFKACVMCGKMSNASAVCASLVRSYEEAYGPDHPKTNGLRELAANMLRGAGEAARALPLAEELLRSRERALGPGHEDTVSAEMLLVMVYSGLGRFGEAAGHCSRAIRRLEALRGPDDLVVLGMRHSLAGLCRMTGDHARRKRILSGMQKSFQKIGKSADVEALDLKNMLAKAYAIDGGFSEALALFGQVLEESAELLGPEDPYTLSAKHSLASVCRSLGQFPRARRLYREALEARERILGPDHEDSLETRMGLEAAELMISD